MINKILLISILLIQSLQSQAGEEKFIYKGIPRTVKTTWGVPVTVGDLSKIKVNNLRPVVIQNPKNGICTKSWEFQILFFDRGLFKCDITTEESQNYKHSFLTNFDGPSYNIIGVLSTVYFGDQAECPELWTWMDAQGDSWIPFKVKFTRLGSLSLENGKFKLADTKEHSSDSDVTPYEITQWIKVGKKDIKLLKEKEMEFNKKWESNRTIQKIKTRDNKTYDITLLNGVPPLEDREEVEIMDLYPAFSKSKSGTDQTKAWVAVLRWKSKIHDARVQVSSPISGAVEESKLKKDSSATLYFGFWNETSDLWDWEKEIGDSMVPIKFCFIPDDGTKIEFIQWIKISKEGRKIWNKK